MPARTVTRWSVSPGIRSHRTKHLERNDVRIHRGLPVTSPARTLVDVMPLGATPQDAAHPRAHLTRRHERRSAWRW